MEELRCDLASELEAKPRLDNMVSGAINKCIGKAFGRWKACHDV